MFVNDTTLVISNATLNDSAPYTCHVANRYGRVYRTAWVTVLPLSDAAAHLHHNSAQGLLVFIEPLTTREAACYIISVVFVCDTITFESLYLGSSFSHIRYLKRIRIKFVYEGHSVKVKVIEAKTSKISTFAVF